MQFSQRVSHSTNPNGKPGNTLFFTSTPPLEELCTVFLSVQTQQLKNGSVNSFQPQVIKCRELIFTEPEIIASPVMGAGGKVQIITQITVYKSGKLQARFQRMNIEVTKPKRVTPSDYQACLKYTLLARMAPLWNKVGDYLIEGREFVTSTEKLNAIAFNLNVNKSELYINLSAYQVRIPPIKLDDLHVCPRLQEEFLSSRNINEIAKLDEYAIANKWCHILPSMKKGMVVNVLHSLPSDSPFKSYKDVKKYWKNMYGYRLPETDEGLLYYQVYFKPIGHTLFTYPECCIRLRDVITFKSANTEQVMQQFLADIHNRMPLLCGQKIAFLNKAMYTVPKLSEVNHRESNTPPNLTSSAPLNTGRPKPTQEKRIQLYTAWKPSGLADKIENTSSTVGYNTNATAMNESRCASNNVTNNNDCVASGNKNGLASASLNVIKVSEVSAAADESEKSLKNINEKQYNQNIGVKKIKPVFKPKIQAKSILDSKSSSSTNPPKVIPVFKANPKPLTRVTSSKPPFCQNKTDKFANLELVKAKLGNFDTGNRNVIMPPSSIDVTTSQLSFQSQRKPSFGLRLNTNGVHDAASQLSVSKNTVKPYFGAKQTVFSSNKETSNNTDSGSQFTPKKVNLQSVNNVYTPTSNATVSQSCTPSSQKRKLNQESIENDGKLKKLKTKPKLQEGVDVEMLARNNQLAKLNTLTLITWLKNKGVPCKSRDKKGDLVTKVMQSLQLNVAEQ